MQSITLYKRLLKYVKPYWRLVVVMLVATAVYASTNAIYASKLKTIIDDGFINKDMQAIHSVIITMLVVTFFRGIGFFVSGYMATRISSDVVLTLRKEMFSKLQRLPTSYFDRVNSGETLSRFNYHVEQVTLTATDGVIVLVREGTIVIALLSYLLYKNWKLTLLILILVPVIAGVVHFISKRLKKLAKRTQNNIGDMNHILDENIKGQKIVKIYNGSAREEKRFAYAVRQIRHAAIKSQVAVSASTPIIELFIVSVICLVIWFMALEAKAGEITAGAFLSYVIMMGLLPSPIKKLLNINGKVQKGLVASDEIFDFLDELSEQSAPANTTPQTETTVIKTETDHSINDSANRARGELAFEAVNFTYPGTNEAVLNHFNLHIRAGETVALVGASGSGKSSVAALIPRFYDVDSGVITLDGQPINALDLAHLRAQIAFVNQDTVLFNDSVARNIAYADEQPDMARVQKAAQLAQAEGFILEMDNGYDSPIGEAGQRLSGGQKQRLAIARALYKDAPILILDEATSALDRESEYLVQKALDELLHHRTAIIIAHRLSTIENADRIVVLDKGHIVESGTHDELMRLRGRFFHLNSSLENLLDEAGK